MPLLAVRAQGGRLCSGRTICRFKCEPSTRLQHALRRPCAPWARCLPQGAAQACASNLATHHGAFSPLELGLDAAGFSTIKSPLTLMQPPEVRSLVDRGDCALQSSRFAHEAKWTHSRSPDATRERILVRHKSGRCMRAATLVLTHADSC